MTNTRIISVLVIAAAACSSSDDTTSKPASDKQTSGGHVHASAAGFTGVGWSIAPETERATREALEHAEAGKPNDVDLTFVYYTPQHDPAHIIATLRGTEKRRRVIGMSSHDGLLTADGYHSSDAGVVGVLALQVGGMAM